jgi:hypothetical protein
MSEFINRFLNIRYVVRNVYTQIHDLELFLELRAESLGKHMRESYDQFLRRSYKPETHIFEYEYREDYIDEIKTVVNMVTRVKDSLEDITRIYIDLLDILRINLMDDNLNDIDDTEEDIIQKLLPNVCLDGLDEAMDMNGGLSVITERIHVVMYQKGAFHIDGRDDLWRILRQNRLSTGLEAVNCKQWLDIVGETCEMSKYMVY